MLFELQSVLGSRSFYVYHPMPRRIALVLSEVFIRRLTPSLAPFVRGKLEFRIIDMRRPIEEITILLEAMEPAALVTEWLPPITSTLLSLGYPTVVADTDEVFPGATSVDVDDKEVGREAASYFLRAGYRHFACVGNGTPYATQRMKSFSRTLRQEGFSCTQRTEAEQGGVFYMESWRAADSSLADWLASLPKPLAVFAVHDPLGRMLCEACHHAGLHVPDEVSVIGANNDELVCNLSYPALSSVVIPWDRLGAAVGEAIEELLDTGTPRPHPIMVRPGSVMARESTDLVATQDLTLRRSLSYLQEHYRDPITIGRMCSDLRISRRSLERRFTEHLGRTPWEILCQLRVEQAKRLLVETTQPISRIADLAGFSDAERLAVVFKRLTGRRPSDFRSRPTNTSSTAENRAKSNTR